MITVIIRTALIYVFVILAVRIMGKRQVADMQTTEFVTTLIISEVASLPMQNIDQPLVSGFIPILVLIAVEIIVSIIMMKNRKFRSLVCGHPIVVIMDGEILREELKKLRISYEDLYSLLRQQQVFEVADIKFGVIEPNGSLSVLKTADAKAGAGEESEELRYEIEQAKLDREAKAK